jgi:L-ascorbate metabolism protein UlaG (beta-lactamase superfamily)
MPSTKIIDGIEFTRYVQSAFKIKVGDTVIWIDPHRVGAQEVGGDRADLILVTHPHPDHMDPAAIEACVGDGAVLVTNPTVATELGGKLFAGLSVVAIADGQETEQAGVKVKAVSGYNEFHPRGDNTGFLISVGGRTIFHAGDTNNVPGFASLGVVDVALYPIGGTYTSDEEDAAAAVRAIRPKTVVPMHYGYATGGDPERFRSLVGDAAIVEVIDPVLDVKYA